MSEVHKEMTTLEDLPEDILGQICFQSGLTKKITFYGMYQVSKRFNRIWKLHVVPKLPQLLKRDLGPRESLWVAMWTDRIDLFHTIEFDLPIAQMACQEAKTNVIKLLVPLSRDKYSLSTLMHAAAFGGHVHVVELLLKLGIPYNPAIIIEGAYHGHYNLVKWCILKQKASRWHFESWILTSALRNAKKRGHVAIQKEIKQIMSKTR